MKIYGTFISKCENIMELFLLEAKGHGNFASGSGAFIPAYKNVMELLLSQKHQTIN